MIKPNFVTEQRLGGRVAGVDEVGRGPLAGPVVAVAVVFSLGVPDDLASMINDSKKLRPSVRNRIAALLPQIKGVEMALGAASVREIDNLNILKATHLAMRRAVERLPTPLDHILVDGNIVPDFGVRYAGQMQAIIGGDSVSLSIAAASIIAKVTRDRIMTRLAQRWPHYVWQKNVGYGTLAHRQALKTRGISPHHRKTFSLVREIMCVK